MSLSAVTWALQQESLGRPCVKFTLALLAYHADERDRTRISVTELALTTGHGPKTIARALRELQALKLIEDTGERVGQSKLVRVYRLRRPPL